jgi:hypothetical protein
MWYTVHTVYTIVVVPDPDRHRRLAYPDRNRINASDRQMKKVDKVYFVQKNIQYAVKKLKIMTFLTLMRKIKHCKLAKL